MVASSVKHLAMWLLRTSHCVVLKLVKTSISIVFMIRLSCRAISQFEAAQMSNIVASLNCILSSPYENQRVVVAAFFAEVCMSLV